MVVGAERDTVHLRYLRASAHTNVPGTVHAALSAPAGTGAECLECRVTQRHQQCIALLQALEKSQGLWTEAAPAQEDRCTRGKHHFKTGGRPQVVRREQGARGDLHPDELAVRRRQ